MLNALFLALATISQSAQAILKKSYTVRTEKRGSFLFSAISVLFAAFFFLAISGMRLHITAEILPYAFGFALFYGMAVLSGLLAIRCGSLALTSLVSAYSLMIPTFFGILFLDEKADPLFYLALLILGVSLFLMNAGRRGVRITPAWVAIAFCAFLGNGLCSTVQTAQQKAFGGQYKSEMMVVALLSVFFVMLLLSLILERGEIPAALRRGAPCAVVCGLFNGVCNLLVMVLAVRMAASLLFPVISAGGILLTGLVSRVIYKERLSAGQYTALLLGTISVILMNL